MERVGCGLLYSGSIDVGGNGIVFFWRSLVGFCRVLDLLVFFRELVLFVRFCRIDIVVRRS